MIDTDLFFGIESPGTQISIIPLYQHSERNSSNDQLLDFKLHHVSKIPIEKKRKKNYSLNSTFVPLFCTNFSFFQQNQTHGGHSQSYNPIMLKRPPVAAAAEHLVPAEGIRVSDPNLELIAPSSNFRIF